MKLETGCKSCPGSSHVFPEEQMGCQIYGGTKALCYSMAWEFLELKSIMHFQVPKF